MGKKWSIFDFSKVLLPTWRWRGAPQARPFGKPFGLQVRGTPGDADAKSFGGIRPTSAENAQKTKCEVLLLLLLLLLLSQGLLGERCSNIYIYKQKEAKACCFAFHLILCFHLNYTALPCKQGNEKGFSRNNFL